MLADKFCGNTSTQWKGPAPFLGREVEDCLATWLMKMAHIGYGQTHDTLFDKVQDIVVRLKKPTLFNNGRPSKQWYYLFMKQHPYLGIQQAQLLSHEGAGIRYRRLVPRIKGLSY